MKKMLALSLALAAAVSVSACQTQQQTNALAGGALGGGAGALIGSAVTHGSPAGTIAGAALWKATRPQAPEGDWFKDFGSYILAGTGPYPKTVLTPGMKVWGTKLAHLLMIEELLG